MNFDPKTTSTHPALKLISPMILVYLMVLALVDQIFYTSPVLAWDFYLIIGVSALVIAILTYIPAVSRMLGRLLIPLIIALLIVVPVFSDFISMQGENPMAGISEEGTPADGPPTGGGREAGSLQGGGPEIETLRLIPLTFTALVLVAWQYRMQHVFLFTLFTILVQGFVTFLRYMNTPDIVLSPWYVVITIQALSLIIVGYFINLLVEQLKKQQTELQTANQNLINYSSTLESLTISRERNAMARELHDTVAHTLSGLSMQLETANAYLDVDKEATRAMLEKSLAATRSGLDDTRAALQSLRASPLEDLGLVNAIKDTAVNIASRGNMKLSLTLPPAELYLPEAYEQVIFRIVQEAMNNILHHANASTVMLSLTRMQYEIHLIITDDGIGFDPEQQFENHFGLVGMRERAALVGGELMITSQPNAGTRIHLRLRSAE